MILDAIVGTWDLTACEVVAQGAATTYPLGHDAVGVLTYSPCGTMFVAIMRNGRASFAAADILLGTDAERAAAAAGYLSYAGRFALDGERMLHRIEVSLFPNWVGVVQKRRVHLDGDALTLATDPLELGGRTCVARMTWKRRAP